MNLREKQNNKGSLLVLTYIVLYICTINIWHKLFGDRNYPRTVFFIIILFFAFSYFVNILKQGKTNIDSFRLLVFILYCLIVVVINSNQFGWSSAYPYIIIPLMFFAFSFLTKNTQQKTVISIIVWCGTVISLLSIYEYASHSYLLPSIYDIYKVFRCRVFADSCLSLGCQLAVTSLLSAYMAINTKKAIYILLVFINFAGIITTSSRGPLVSCVIAFLLMYICNNSSLKKEKYLNIAIIITTIVLISGIILFSYSYIEIDPKENPILYRILSIFDWSSDHGNVRRLEKWSYYLNVFIHRPVFGHGIGYISNSSFGVTESGVIQRFVELGAVGTLLYYNFVFGVLRKGFQTIRTTSDPYKRNLLVGCICPVICILVEDFILQIFTNTIVNILFWFCVAIIHHEVQNVEYDNPNVNKYG